MQRNSFKRFFWFTLQFDYIDFAKGQRKTGMYTFPTLREAADYAQGIIAKDEQAGITIKRSARRAPAKGSKVTDVEENRP